MNPMMKRYLPIAGLLFSVLLPVQCAKATENNLQFSGNLVSEPCKPDPLTNDLTVYFGSVIEKSLYLDTRTSDETFTINLTECDTSISRSVVMTFKGLESDALPGDLAVTGVTGIAIGLKNPDGSPLPINQPAPQLALSDGANSFTFKAYVTGEPAAIQEQSITPGDFTATATFEMAYP